MYINKEAAREHTLESWESMYENWQRIATAPLSPKRAKDEILSITRDILLVVLNILKIATTSTTPTSNNHPNMTLPAHTDTATLNIIKRRCTTPLPPPIAGEFPMKNNSQPDMAGDLPPGNFDPDLSPVTPAHKPREEDNVMTGSPDGGYGFPTHSHSPLHFLPMNYSENTQNNPTTVPRQTLIMSPEPQQVSKTVEEGVAISRQTFGHQKDPTIREAVMQAQFIEIMRRKAETT